MRPPDAEPPDAAAAPAGPAATQTADFGRSAGILSAGLAATGLVTFAFFAVSSHVLDADAYTRIVLLWSVMFIVISTIYRPIEQLLSRAIAARVATGMEEHPLRAPVAIQMGFSVAFLAGALAARGPLQDDLFDGSATVYWALIGGVLTYGAAYFARGWLAGHKHFFIFGWLVLLDAATRACFPLAVAFGIGGEEVIAVGIAAAPLLSLVVVPFALREPGSSAGVLAPSADAALEGPGAEGAQEAADLLSLGRGAGFALAVLGIMLAEQTLLNVPVLTVDAATSDPALAGFVFNVLLISRAPLQLFQAVQISLLPHLAGLDATDGHEAFREALRVTAIAIAAFTLLVALGLLAVGPPVMDALFGGNPDYARTGLALMGLGMGLHLFAGAINQAALVRGRAASAAACWLVAAAAFIAWLLAAPVADRILRVETGYLGATALLSALLLALTRRG